MIYPQKISAKKSGIIIKSLMTFSIIVGILLVVINRLTTPDIHWAGLCNAGIIYIWVTVMYSINKNINIAGHVLVQTIALSILTVYIDMKLGFKAWSIDIAIPILITIANVTMLVLTIVSHKKYIRYAIYQLLICIFSMIPLFFIYENIAQNKIMCFIASGLSIVNLLLTICLSARDIKEAIVRNFHM